MPRLKLGVLISGNGTTLQNLLEYCAEDKIDASIAVVISSRAEAFGLERARRRGVPALTIARKEHASVESFSDAIFGTLEAHAVDLICTAGFMSLLKIPSAFENRIINVHPSLLPAFGGKGFYGHFVHEAVLAHGCKISGCTVHFVDNLYDNGPIIAQYPVLVREDDTPDTLAERVQEAERKLFPLAIQALAEGRINIVNRVVKLAAPRS